MALAKNLYINQGASFVETIDTTDSDGNTLNLNYYTITAQIKKTYSAIETMDFDVTIINNTQIKLYLDSYATSKLTSLKYVYDVILSDENGNVERIQEGTIIVSPGVSKCQ